MVTFKLFSKNGDTLVYRYYPEGQVDYGVIIVDRSRQTIAITQLAPNDFVRNVSDDELNSLRNSANALRMEEGLPALTEKEWPSATETVRSTFYADHVIRRLDDSLEGGDWPESGTVMWY